MPELPEVETLARDLRSAVQDPHPDLPVTPLPPAGEGPGVRVAQQAGTKDE